jgi:hypothetical protein
MPLEHAFLRERLALVERWLANPDRDFIPTGKRRVRRRTQPVDREDLVHKREARLLRNLLASTREGQVLATLQAWRGGLGESFSEHREQYKEMQESYDAWWRLPPHERSSVPRPPKPPSARYVYHDGAPWSIDDRFLAVLLDLIERLQKWLGEA